MSSFPRRVKIVATLGPSSSDLSTLENLIKAGVDVFRLNFSHGTHEDHQQRIELIRQASQKCQKPVAILQDLQGPKLRVGRFTGGSMPLEKSEKVTLYYEKDRTTISEGAGRIPYNYEALPREIKLGHRILIDDGNLELCVINIKEDEIEAQVVFGGTLKDHKGMNFPDTTISIPSFTEKDRKDLLFGLTQGVDYVALSFVRTADDIRLVQRYIHSHKLQTPVIAKIEMAEAMNHLNEILDVTDGVMVARGDLAVEVGPALVPSYQKEILQKCRARGIPVITATQMLESMISNPRPTRAEASDVANAVLDGTDAVMLSAETASGKFPVLTVTTMEHIIVETERRYKRDPRPQAPRDCTVVEGIEYAAAHLLDAVGAKLVLCLTSTGDSAQALSRFRPDSPIIAISDKEAVSRRLALYWGIRCYIYTGNIDSPTFFDELEEFVVREGVLSFGDLYVLTGGSPALKHGSTNTISLRRVKIQLEKSTSSQEENLTSYRTRKAQFILDHNLCIHCRGCVEVCPNDIFGYESGKVYLKEHNCKNCTFDQACVDICPTDAIEIVKFN